MRIRGAVFDFDGTLVDSNEIKRRTWFEVARGADPVVRSVLERWPGADRYRLSGEIARALELRRALPAGATREQCAKQLAHDYTAACEEAIVACAEIPGAGAALEWLRARGVPAFVNSATPLDPLERVLRRRGMLRCLAGVHGGPRSKVENLRDIGSGLGARPDELVLVGDGDDDRRAAAVFGCRFVPVSGDLRALPGLLARWEDGERVPAAGD